jgi:hypothetical protein
MYKSYNNDNSFIIITTSLVCNILIHRKNNNVVFLKGKNTKKMLV